MRWNVLIRTAPLAGVLATAAVVAAQPPPPRPFHHPPFALRMEPRVEGVPFRAESVAEFTSNGKDDAATRRSTGVVARDTAGRTRNEDAMGPDAARMVAIDDPVAKVRYVFSPDREHGRKFTRWLPPPKAERFHGPHDAKGGPPPVKKESLGTETIAGVAAEGTRETITLPAGAHGNAAPEEIVFERWYSDELQTIVRRSHRDARGERTWTLTEITRGEPDASLFEVPSNIAIEEDVR